MSPARKPAVCITDEIYSDDKLVRHYAGIWAFGYLLLRNPDLVPMGWSVGRGDSEAFYRTLHSLAIDALAGVRPTLIWDVGCGVGRSVHDLAGTFPDATVVGIDRSRAMLDMAERFLFHEADFDIDLRDAGFGAVRVNRTTLPCRANALLVETDSDVLPARTQEGGARPDLIILANVLDRTPRPEELLQSAVFAVDTGKYVLIGITGSWQHRELWYRCGEATRWCLTMLNEMSVEVLLAFDGVNLREVMDRSGAAEDYPVTMILARRRL